MNCPYCGKEMYYSPYYKRMNCMHCTVEEREREMTDAYEEAKLRYY